MAEEGALDSAGVTEGGGDQITGKPAEEQWTDVFGEEAKTLERFNFKTPTDMVKSFNEAQKMISSSIRIPSDEAGEEQWNDFYSRLEKVPNVARIPGDDSPEDLREQFYNQLGRPAKPDEYRVSERENYQDDEASLNALREVAHRNGLSQKAFGEIRDFLADGITSDMEAKSQQTEQSMEHLKGDWGEAFDQNLNIARGAVKSLASDDFLQFLDESGLGNHPDMIKGMYEFGRRMQEPEMKDLAQSNFKSPADLDFEIQDIMARPEYWDEEAVNHQELVSKVHELTQRKFASI